MAVAAIEIAQAANQRGEETRRRLIEAAIEVFGSYSFEGASTRLLAKKAGVNLAAIPYYFGGKEGLYRAAAQFIADRFGERMSVIEEIDQALKNARLPRREHLRLLHELLNAFAALVIGSREAERWCSFILREQMQPGAAFEILYRGVMHKVHAACAALVGRLLDQPQDDPATGVHALALIGQVVVFRTGRAAAMRTFGWKDLSEARVKFIQSVLDEHIDRIVSRARVRRS